MRAPSIPSHHYVPTREQRAALKKRSEEIKASLAERRRQGQLAAQFAANAHRLEYWGLTTRNVGGTADDAAIEEVEILRSILEIARLKRKLGGVIPRFTQGHREAV